MGKGRDEITYHHQSERPRRRAEGKSETTSTIFAVASRADSQKREKAERRSVVRKPDRHRKTDRIASVATFVVVVCLHWLPRAPDCLTKADNLINSSLEPNGTNSLQLFVVEFDTYLVWELLLLPSNAQTAPN